MGLGFRGLGFRVSSASAASLLDADMMTNLGASSKAEPAGLPFALEAR